MNWSRLKSSENNHVFRGSQLVSSILERHPTHFQSRATALKFCRQLFNDGIIRGVFGADTFEDSVQLYTWKDQNGATMTSYPVSTKTSPSYGYSGADVKLTRRDLYLQPGYVKPTDTQTVHHVQSPQSQANKPPVNRHRAGQTTLDISTGVSSSNSRPLSKQSARAEFLRQRQGNRDTSLYTRQEDNITRTPEGSNSNRQSDRDMYRHNDVMNPYRSHEPVRPLPDTRGHQGLSPMKPLDSSNAYTPSSYHKPQTDSRTINSSSEIPHALNVNQFYKDLTRDLEADVTGNPMMSKQISSYQTSWNLQRASTASSESSVDILSHSYSKHKDKNSSKGTFTTLSTTMPQSRGHDAIPEEVPEDHVMERTTTSTEYDGSSSIPRSVATSGSGFTEMDNLSAAQRYQDCQNSYSDNEKQLIEQMKLMKKEHSHILRTYEDRINKLMAKMHELRSIAEMLENSSTKSSPYGMITSKANIMNFLASSKHESDRKLTTGVDREQPPPLPPRPGRGSRLNPNKPVIQTDAKMKQLPWTRIILKDEGDEEQTTIWHTMNEPKLDSEEIERLFSLPEVSQTDGATLYDDLIIRRGRSRQQLVSIYDSERSKKIVVCMKCLRATLNDVIATVSSLNTSQVNHEGLVELMELLASVKEMDKILYHVRKKGAGHLDHPEYLVFELSKVDHFQDRLEFIRFRFKMQWHLFEIDQQMRELHTACDEIANSTSLKNLLETLLAVGNYLNGTTEMGQADGYALEVINTLKEAQDRDGKGTLLEFVLKTYCQIYESEVDIGCPTRFRLPEPSNMRHAAQVSFEGIQDALSNLHADLRHVREKLLNPQVNKDTTRPMDSFRVIAENFFAAALEVIGEQEKILQDTRDAFDKTVRFFVVENQAEVTPQQFFHVWAVFLHDCKYFWKLAHRRLAKERFELEFKYKGQMSACSLNGYGTFLAGVQDGVNSSRISDPKTSTAQRKMNQWMAQHLVDGSPKPVVPPKPARANDAIDGDEKITMSSSQRSASPKPLTSTPPTSSHLHKPLPKAPIVTQTPISGSNYPSPNYENQSELDRFQHKHASPNLKTEEASQQRTALYIPPDNRNPSSSKEKKSSSSQQFSLKAWLKREREQVRRDVESEATSPPYVKETKQQTQSKPFAKFKNSMMQKFSGGSSGKKGDVGTKENKDNKYVQPDTNISSKGTMNHVLPYGAKTNTSPYIVNSVAITDRTNPPFANHRFDCDDTENPSLTEAIISPIEDLEEETPLKTTSPYGRHLNYGIVKPERRDTEVTDRSGDVNNNDKFSSDIAVGQTQAGHQTSHMYDTRDFFTPPRQTDSHYTPLSSEQAISKYGADSKYVKGQPVPVYTAKIINNYENQGKFETPNAIRQQAEAVVDSSQVRHSLSAPYDNPSRKHTEFMSPYMQESESQNTDFRSPELTNNADTFYFSQEKDASGKHNSQLDSSLKPTDYGRVRYSTSYQSPPTTSASLYSHTYVQSDKYNNNSSYMPNGNQGTNDTNQDSPYNGHVDQTENKQGRATFKTASSGKGPGVEDTNSAVSETSPPLPPRSPSKSTTSPRSSRPVANDNQRHQDSRTAKQLFMSPYARLDNLTLNPSTPLDSPASVYTTPPSHLNTPNSCLSPQRTNGTYSQNNYPTSSTYSQTPSRDNYDRRDTDKLSYSGFNRNVPNGHAVFAENRNKQGAKPEDDGYRAMLRRAANVNHDRYGRLDQYTGRPSFGNGSNGHSSLASSPGQPTNTTAVVKPSVYGGDPEVSYMAF